MIKCKWEFNGDGYSSYIKSYILLTVVTKKDKKEAKIWTYVMHVFT